jgi:gamma-glutamyltranspeptidase/glutathione hydrolase
MPPPSSGGAHVIEILNILEGFPIREQGLNAAATIHEMAEAEKLAYADRARWLGDPAFVRVPLKGLTSKAYADQLRATILPDRARPPRKSRPAIRSATRAIRPPIFRLSIPPATRSRTPTR